MISMEEILQKYFNCKKPFKKNGKLSTSGINAYSKLVDLLYDIDSLVEINVYGFIDELDELAPSDNLDE